MNPASQDITVELRTGRRLSPTQRGFLASHIRHCDSAALNMALVVTFDTVLDSDRLARAFDTVVQASDVLRTQISFENTTVAQVAAAPPAITEQVDLSAMGEADLAAWTTEFVRRPFDLATCSYRSTLITHGGVSLWCLAMHHLVTDATSMKLIIEATVASYLGTDPEPSHFYRWAEALERDPSERSAKQADYWLARPPAERHGRVYRSSDRTTSGASRHRLTLGEFEASMASAVEADYRMLSPELSWAAFLTTATAIYLHRLTGSANFSIGVPVHHRNNDQTATVIGPTMGVYPVDVHVDSDDTHRTLHRRVARSLMTMLGNANPMVGAPGDYDVVVNVIPNVTPTPGDLTFSTRWVHAEAIDPEHVLRVQATRYDRDSAVNRGIDIDLDLHHQAADDDQRQRAGHHFSSVLRSMVTKPDASIFEADVVAPDERVLIVNAEAGQPVTTEPAPLVERLAAVLAGNPSVVLSTADGELTGQELWSWATAIARDLNTTERVGARVAIALGPSAEAVAAIYGCLIAGRPFVPLDPLQPPARSAELSRRAGVTRTFSSCEEVAAYRTATNLDSTGTDASFGLRSLDDEAYLLFTSGSTGIPKGVPISGRGLGRYIDFAIRTYFPNKAAPIAPLFTALTFDLTITTLFAPIIRGGRLVVLNGPGPVALTEFAAARELNWCKATPSHLEVLATLLPEDHQLSVAVVGGEAFRSDLAERLLAHNPEMAIFNEYGPTEAVVGCMIHRVDPADAADEVAVPIGVPAPGVTLRVVDPGGSRVPIGVPGELWIAHDGLTAGYLAEPGGPTTSSPFVVVDGQRFYTSGDLVERNQDLGLTYLGRIDEQLKVGGIRLDPSEVENALLQHPAIERAAVRQWSPEFLPAAQHCVRCGLASNVPGTIFDDQGVCGTCHDYDRIAPMAASWFRTEADLVSEINTLTPATTGDYDCLHLMSGGKDSTYALYKLVELGLKPYALTLDNGFISQGALDNVRRCAEDLGVDYEFATTSHMDAIFRDSLTTFSDVCHGCYKTIYTLATNRAVELNIPVIVTGLSRGQLFETRLIPGQFQQDRFDPAAIDRAVVEARKRYHRAPDFVNQVLDTEVFESENLFDRLHYIDIYRYLDVELTEVLGYLSQNTPWQRPADTGRSSNCLINIAGIYAHQVERGYHNYAEPYAWDVRLGHKQRDESMAELDDPIDPTEISRLLGAIGYTPKPKQVFTGWYQVAAGITRPPTPAELRTFLGDRLPQHAIPAAFVHVEELTTTANGKLDEQALPPPNREHRAAVGAYLAAESERESQVITVWEAALGIAPISANDDFFALGGDSLAAVTMIVELGTRLGLVIREELAFAHTTPRQLAAAIDMSDQVGTERSADAALRSRVPVVTRHETEPPELSAGEMSILFDQQSRPTSAMYNVGRIFDVASTVDSDRLYHAIRAALAHHEPLTWSYGAPRRRIDVDATLAFSVAEELPSSDAVRRALPPWLQAPFDLDAGPLLRCRIFPIADASTVVVFAIHHVTGDNQSLDLLWEDINRAYQGLEITPSVVGYGDYCAWQRQSDAEHRQFWSSQGPFPEAPVFGQVDRDAPDGYLAATARVTPAQLRSTAGRTGVSSTVAAAAAAVAPFFEAMVEVDLITSTRDHPAADRLFGYLLNPVPLTFDTSAVTLGELAASASITIGQHLSHRSYPFAEVVSDARGRDAQPPTGRVLVAYNDRPHAELAGASVRQQVVFNGSAVADITFFAEPDDKSVHLGVEYNGRAVPTSVAALLLERFDLALAAISSQQELRAQDLPLPAPSVLSGPELADHELVLTKFVRHLNARSDTTAIEVGSRTLTWHQLGARANQVADELEKRGIGAGDRVAVRIGRSVELSPAIIGVLLSGASYVPVDPTYPADRIVSMLKLSNARAELTTDPESSGPSNPGMVSITVTDETIAGIPWVNEFTPRTHQPAGADEAYLIFTSGSTGTPQGVAVTHDQLAASTNARAQFYEAAPDRFLMLSSVSFDSSVVGLFWTLTTGATLLLPDDAAAHDIDRLSELFTSSKASHVLCVPTLYSAILDQSQLADSWPGHVIVAGEACTPALVHQHTRHAPSSQLTNEYGPTEATVWATAYHCDLTEQTAVPIGTPIAGMWLAVVNNDGHIQPQGVPGELVLGGPNVVAGYSPANDSERFVDASARAGLASDLQGRAFRTGDHVALIKGQIVFLGRVDDQLNVGGARVEPTEIERHLELVDGVSQIVVVGVDVRPIDRLLDDATEHQAAEAMQQAAASPNPAQALRRHLQTTGRPDIRLVAHLAGPNPVDEALLRDAVASLPATHRPSMFRHHVELPTLPNGKVDRAAAAQLPVDLAPRSPALTAGSTNAADGSSDDVVVFVQQLFADALQVSVVNQTDSFFDLGGDSLRAIELLRIIEERTGTRLSTSAIHNAPTPHALAETLSAHGLSTSHDLIPDTAARDDVIVMRLQPEGTATPIFALHNLGIDGAMWRPLSGHLGDDVPMYGIADPFALLDPFGDSYNLEHRPEIHDTAARYVEHIETLAPTGPVSLVGFCVGGVFGYEVAQQLQHRGRQVDNLIIVFDRDAPFLGYDENWWNLPLMSYRRSEKAPLEYLRDVLGRRAFLKRVRRSLERVAVSGATRLRLPLPERLQARQYVEDGINRVENYVHQPYRGRVTVLRSVDDPRIPADLGDQGWGDLIGDLEVSYIPGVGERMLYEPNVGALADVVRARR